MTNRRTARRRELRRPKTLEAVLGICGRGVGRILKEDRITRCLKQMNRRWKRRNYLETGSATRWEPLPKALGEPATEPIYLSLNAPAPAFTAWDEQPQHWFAELFTDPLGAPRVETSGPRWLPGVLRPRPVPPS